MTGPEFLFSYPLLPFFKPLPDGLLYFLLGCMLISTVMIVVGLYLKYALSFFCIFFTYFSFIDKTLYNNHLYLMSLIALVLIFMESGNRFSRFTPYKKTAPAWNIRLLQFLIFIVYFYGGIAKINDDWINGGIVSSIVNATSDSGTKTFIPEDTLIQFIAIGGIVFDLLITFILLWKPTRLLGIILVLVFNLMNGYFLFDDIGVFPVFMIGTLVLFLDPVKVDSFIGNIFPTKSNAKKKHKKKRVNEVTVQQNSDRWTHAQKRTTILLVGFVIFHLVWPLRHHVLTYNPEWTGHGSRFAWRMKMQTRTVERFEMTLSDGESGNSTIIDYSSFLTLNQRKHLTNDPFQIVQFAKYLKQKAIRKGMANDPVIKATVMVKFNNRPSQLMIDPNIDLTEVDESPFADYSWIMPLTKQSR